MKRNSRFLPAMTSVVMIAMLLACGGGGTDNGTTTPPPALETFTLNWSAPTSDVGGGELTGLAGYNIYYGASPRSGEDPKTCTLCGYTQKVDAGNVTSYSLRLEKGTYYFAVTAYDASGNESVFTAPEISATK